MRLSVTVRVALLALALALVSNLALVGFVWQSTRADAIGSLSRETIERADALVAVYRVGGLAALDSTIGEARRIGDASLIAAVFDADGRRVAGFGPMHLGGLRPISFTLGDLGMERGQDAREAGFSLRPVGRRWLLSGRLLDSWRKAQQGIERALALSLLLSLSLGLIGGLVLARYVARRLDLIAGAVDAVASGDLTRRVAAVEGGHDAFDRLGGQLNAMLDKVERLMTELRVMTDSLAHDLRSPLARLRTKAENAALQSDPVQREAALASLIAETDIVMGMLATLLEITRSEAMSRDRFTPLDPAALIAEIAELYEPVFEDAGIAFAVQGSVVAVVAVHRELLSQAIANLLDNAIKHGSGGEIALRLAREAGAIRIEVADRGRGIAAADQATALRRFGRLDAARSEPGAGLGLALVEAVARLHGGRLELGDNAPGLVARIVVPI